MSTDEVNPGSLFQFEIPFDGTPVRSAEIRNNFTALAQLNYTEDPTYPANPRNGTPRIEASTSKKKLQVWLDGEWITLIDDIGTPTVVGKMSLEDKSLFVAVPTAGDDSDTGLLVTDTPVAGSYFGVSVRGLSYEVGDGVKTGDCYFSADGGTTARAQGEIEEGDTLFWNGVISGRDLQVTDRVDFFYMTSS